MSAAAGEGDGGLGILQWGSGARDEAARDRSVRARQQPAARDADRQTGTRDRADNDSRSRAPALAREVTHDARQTNVSAATSGGRTGVRSPERATRPAQVPAAGIAGGHDGVDDGRHGLQPDAHGATITARS